MGLRPQPTDQRTQHWAIFPQLPVTEASCPFSHSFLLSCFNVSGSRHRTVMLSEALLRAIPCRNAETILSTRLLRLLLTTDARTDAPQMPPICGGRRQGWGCSKGGDAFFHPPLPLWWPPCSFLNHGLPAEHSAAG